MSSRERELDEFFNRYAARFNVFLKTGEVDIESTASAFTENFLEASPAGVICGKNDESFREAIPKGYAFYKSIGMITMEISRKNISLLDEMHSMCKIGWKSVFRKSENQFITIGFDVFYLVQSVEGEHRIFAYVTGDEQAALRKNGLI